MQVGWVSLFCFVMWLRLVVWAEFVPWDLWVGCWIADGLIACISGCGIDLVVIVWLSVLVWVGCGCTFEVMICGRAILLVYFDY